MYERCNHCGRIAYLEGGLCSDCKSYLHATGKFTYSSGGSSCPACGGTGQVTHVFGPATKCTACNGTGRQ